MHGYWIPSSFITQKLESVAQLEYMFVIILAINTRSDPRILEGGGFGPFKTGLETGSATDRLEV